MSQTLLLQHPDVQAIWSFTEGLSLGVSATLKAQNKTVWSGNRKGIIVVARNGTSAAAEAIRTGNMTATWDNNQPLVGAAAVQLLKYLIVDKVKPRSCRRRSSSRRSAGTPATSRRTRARSRGRCRYRCLSSSAV